MEEVKQTLRSIISELYDIDVEPNVTPAPKNVDADLASNVVMTFAKRIGKAPMDVAKEVVGKDDLKTFHTDLAAWMEKKGICKKSDILNGKKKTS